MIQVLQSWLEVGEATLSLQRRALPTHITVQKNWDQWLLDRQLQSLPKSAALLDLGCGDCCTLKFLDALGFTNLSGIDLHLPPHASQLPYRLHQGDLLHMPFADASFDAAISISVIEHGVDLGAFFREADRILKPNGLLFVTTDYWVDKIEVDASIQPFGTSWNIFSQGDIEAAIAIAHTHHFTLATPATIPPCVDQTVTWYNRDYTFIALTFHKHGSTESACGD